MRHRFLSVSGEPIPVATILVSRYKGLERDGQKVIALSGKIPTTDAQGREAWAPVAVRPCPAAQMAKAKALESREGRDRAEGYLARVTGSVKVYGIVDLDGQIGDCDAAWAWLEAHGEVSREASRGFRLRPDLNVSVEVNARTGIIRLLPAPKAAAVSDDAFVKACEEAHERFLARKAAE